MAIVRNEKGHDEKYEGEIGERIKTRGKKPFETGRQMKDLFGDEWVDYIVGCPENKELPTFGPLGEIAGAGVALSYLLEQTNATRKEIENLQFQSGRLSFGHNPWTANAMVYNSYLEGKEIEVKTIAEKEDNVITLGTALVGKGEGDGLQENPE